jgi:hypothetical protein
MSRIKCLKELITDWLLFVFECKTVKSIAVLSEAAAEAYVCRLRVMKNKTPTRIRLFVFQEEQVGAG